MDTVHIRGIHYKSNEQSCYLHIGFLDELPKFGHIQKIWFAPHHGIYFGLQVMTTLKYNDIFNTFQIQEPELHEGLEITHYESLDVPFIFHSYRFRNDMHVIVKENPFSYTRFKVKCWKDFVKIHFFLSKSKIPRSSAFSHTPNWKIIVMLRKAHRSWDWKVFWVNS